MQNDLTPNIKGLRMAYGIVGPLLIAIAVIFLLAATPTSGALLTMVGTVFGLGMGLLITASNCHAMLKEAEEETK